MIMEMDMPEFGRFDKNGAGVLEFWRFPQINCLSFVENLVRNFVERIRPAASDSAQHGDDHDDAAFIQISIA